MPSLLLKGGEAVIKFDFKAYLQDIIDITKGVITAGTVGCLFHQKAAERVIIAGIIWWLICRLVLCIDSANIKNYPKKRRQ